MALKERKIYHKWKVNVRGGRLYYEDEGKFSQHLIPYEGKEMHVIVKPISKNRSRKEEKYYHAVVVRQIAEEMQCSDQEAHEFLKALFLTEEVSNTVNGRTIRFTRVISTTELNDKAYREYWDRCIHWAGLPTMDTGLSVDSGLSIYIPKPNEVDYSNY